MKKYIVAIVFLVISKLVLNSYDKSSASYAQIKYNDIVPDAVLIGTLEKTGMWANYLLDVNQDGTPDFTITNFHPSADQFIMEMSSALINGQCAVLADANNVPKALSKDETIDAGQSNWYELNSGAMHMADNWKDAKDKYLGLRVKVNGEWFYSWVRLDVPMDESSCTVKDFAYESNAGKGLKAGEISGTADVKAPAEIKTKINVVGQMLFIDSEEFTKANSVNIYDSMGKQLISDIYSGSYYTLNLNSFNIGLYFVELKNSTDRIVEKVFVK